MKLSSVGICLSAMLFAMLGCSSRAPQAAAVDQSGTPTQDSVRFPSSAVDAHEAQKNLESSYRAMLASPNVERQFSESVNRLVRVYFRSTGYIHDFDQELKQWPSAGAQGGLSSAMQSETYSKIQAAHAIAHRLEEKILFNYNHLMQDRQSAIELAPSANESAQEAVRLSTLRKTFIHNLTTLSQGEAIFALDNVVKGIREIDKKHGAQVNASRESRAGLVAMDKINGRLLETTQKIGDAHRRFRSQIRLQIEESERDSDLGSKIYDEAKMIQNDIASSFQKEQSERIPAQAMKKIFPSTTPAGNLVGGAFAPKTWVLTFDDGPHPTYTMRIMKAAESFGHKVTFFWLGENVARSGLRPIIQYAKSHGHVIANHSQTHMNFGAVREPNFPQVIESEIDQPTRIETAAYGFRPVFYRCPYGACNKIQPIRQALADRNYVHVFWAVDSLDWNKAANPNGAIDIVERVKGQMRASGRGIILFHDIHPQSAEAASMLWPYFKGLEAEGYRFIDLCQAVDEVNGDPLNTYCAYRK